ncbi:MAG: BPSS1780 family membrane protein [Halothiobacillus sp.]
MQRVRAGRGWGWILDGWQFIKPRLGLAIGVVMLMYVLLFVASMVPFLGNVITPFLSPFLAGGVYIVFRRMREIDLRGQVEPLAREQPISFDLMFSVFRDPAPRKALLNLALVSIGFTLAVLLILATFVTVKLSGIDHSVLTDISATDEQRLRFLMPVLLDPNAWLIWSVGLLGLAVYSMATFFAVPLIVLRGLRLWPALKQSFQAVTQNWVPFLVYGLIWLVLFISVPFTLMLSLIILLPLMFASVFIAFEDLWPEGSDPQTRAGLTANAERTHISTVM